MNRITELADFLRAHDDFALFGHVNPDGDAAGSCIALARALQKLGKRAVVLLPGGIPELYRVFPCSVEVVDGDKLPFAPQTALAVDVSEPNRMGAGQALFETGPHRAVLDHHATNPVFGEICVVDGEAAACGELMYSILAHLGPITAEMALPLYVAVSTDTGCFAYGNTTSNTHAVAAALMATGIDYHTVNKVFFRTKSRKRMQLEGSMLSTCEFYDRDRVAVLSVPISLMERFQATESDAEDLSALGGQIEGVDCAITMRELRPDVWKMSVRTGDRVNATRVCALLGGGGHAAAAGCTVEAPWAVAKARILAAVAQAAPDYES